MDPGERASARRHSASAIRFIIAGRGAFTIEGGHRMTRGANDFVLTPNGTWHGVEADGSLCLWPGGLGIPFVNATNAIFHQVHPDLNQAVGYPVDDMTRTWGSAGLTPGGSAWTGG